MPVERRTGTKQITSVVVGVVVLVVAIVAAWGMIQLASGGKGPVQVRLGEDTFDAGYTSRMAKQIATDGPLLFSDVSGRGQRRPIYVAHFGGDENRRWVALSAVAPGAPEGCFLSWNAARNLFEERRATDSGSETGSGASGSGDGGRRAVGELCRDITWSADGSQGSDGSKIEAFPWRIDDEHRLIIDLQPGRSRGSTTSVLRSGG